MNIKQERGFAFIVELIIVCVVLVVVALAVASSLKLREAKKTTPSVSPAAESKMLRGVALTPKDFTAAGFADFYEQAKALGTSVSWHGDWAELGDASKAPFAVTKTARQYGMEPIILVGTHTEKQGASVAIRPLTRETRANYKRWAVEFVKQYKPRFFGMGNEVNTIAASLPSDFEALVELVNETAAEIKQASPDTKVFVTFQLERLKGLNGGLFGGVNDPAKARWELVKRFEVDVVALTTYPGLIYKTPAEIPADYYEEIRSRVTKPVAFSEVGWSAADVATGWQSSAEAQAQFAERFLELTKPLGPEFAVWLLLYDQETGAAFKSMGLVDRAGNRRAAFGVWQAK